MAFSDKDYKKMASAVVQDYLDGQMSLQDGVIKVADETGMNTHETKRLVEATNVKATLDLFEKEAGDNIVEFDTVNPEEVIDDLFASQRDLTQTKEANVSQRPISRADDFYGKLEDEVTPTKKQHKIAELTAPEVNESVNEKAAALKEYEKTSKLQKIGEKLKEEMHFAVSDYYEELEKFAGFFDRLYGPDLDEFQKKARKAYGKDAYHPLEQLSKMRDEDIDLTQKVASEYVVDDEYIEKFGKLVKQHKEARQRAEALKWFQKRQGQV